MSRHPAPDEVTNQYEDTANTTAPMLVEEAPADYGFPPQQYPGYPPEGYNPQAPPPNGHYPQPVYQPAPVTHTTVHMMPFQRRYYPDYLGFSIINTLFSCMCIGIAAVIKSCAVKRANEKGDPAAEQLSMEALKLNRIALGMAIIITIVLGAVSMTIAIKRTGKL